MKFFVSLLGLLLPILLVNGASIKGGQGGKHVMCYFEAVAALMEQPEVRFVPEDLDLAICTHVVYNRADISEDLEIVPRNRTVDLQEDNGLGILNRTLALKELKPGLEVFIDVYDSDGEMGRHMVSGNSSAFSVFAKNAADFVQSYGFDGMNIRITHPQKCTDEQSEQGYETLIPVIHEEFNRRGIKLMTFLLPIGIPTKVKFELTEPLSRHLDLIVVGSYWKLPLAETEILASLAVLERMIEGYKNLGIPLDKLVVAIPAFTISVKLCDRENSGVNRAFCGEGDEGIYVPRTETILYSSELMRKMANSSEEWQVTRDPESSVSFGHSKSLLWVSYEDPESVRAKAEFVLERDLAGVAIMNSNMEEFKGEYTEGGVTFPLTRAAYNALNGESSMRPLQSHIRNILI